MGPLGKEFDPLWLVSCSVDPPAHFYRDHSILHAVEDENRRLDEADVAFVVVSVSNQQAERQPKIGPPRYLDRRGKGASSTTAATGLAAASRTAWPEPSDSP